MMHGARDLLDITGAVTAPRRRRIRWVAVIDFVLTALGVVLCGLVVGYGLVAG